MQGLGAHTYAASTEQAGPGFKPEPALPCPWVCCLLPTHPPFRPLPHRALCCVSIWRPTACLPQLWQPYVLLPMGLASGSLLVTASFPGFQLLTIYLPASDPKFSPLQA